MENRAKNERSVGSMKKAGLRLVLLALVLVTFLGFIPQSASAAYENTHTNTGNYRQDIIAVALTQVGYRASDGKYNNKYGTYFGNNNDSWCGYFVSWCAAQANVPTSILKRTGWASPSKFGIPSYSGKVYTPQPGDLYFQVNSSGAIIHVGLVVAVDAARGIAITVEGNTWDSSNVHGVYRKERKIKDHIFGVPDYGDGGAAPHDHSYGSVTYESAHPHKAYKSCTTCGYKTYTGETKTVDGCQSCCSHSYGSWSSTGSSSHQRTCTKCGYKDSKGHSWGGDKVVKEATCNEVGKKEQTCATCGATRTTDIPKATKHIWGEWEKLDETKHQKICTLCNTIESEDHTPGAEWFSNEENHWTACSVCNGAIGEERHTEREYCSVPCEVCKYVKPDGHLFEETISWDEDFHFRKCMFCPGQTDITPHQILTTMSADRQEHYYPCAGCGYHADAQRHNLSAPATEENAQICLDCGFEFSPKLPHIHFYRPMQTDWEAHWGVCRCGEAYPKEAHKISAATGLCVVCMEVPPEKPAPTALEWMTEKATAAWESMEGAWNFTSGKVVEAWDFLMEEENRLYLYITAGGTLVFLGGLTTLIIGLARRAKKKKAQPVA